ncbi:MAG: hypothetical protein H8D27_05225 [Chlorobium phaeobacteroides]|nr:hypothetical protein [Chlorobium phaeobacteroides]
MSGQTGVQRSARLALEPLMTKDRGPSDECRIQHKENSLLPGGLLIPNFSGLHELTDRRHHAAAEEQKRYLP